MKAFTTVLMAAGIVALTACSSSSTNGGPVVGTGSGSPSGSQASAPATRPASSVAGSSVLPMASSPPNLAALPGGKARLTPLTQNGPKPDACKVLTRSMVLALIPGAGSDGTVTTPRSDTYGAPTPVVCQYLATPKGSSTGAGNIILDFSVAGHVDGQINKKVYDQDKAAAKDKPQFRDYGARLGPKSLAFYNPNGLKLQVLYNGQPFSIAASGETAASNQDEWRDNDDVAIARNIIARMNG